MPARFYGPELATIHGEAYEGFVLELAPHLLRVLRQNSIRDGHIVDLACGAGGWARELVRRGYEVTGIDVSRSMVRIARRRVPEARFRCGSMVRAKLPRCHAVIATGEAFNYLLRDRGVRRVFRRVFDALHPGGIFLFDATLPRAKRGSRRRAHLRVEKDWALLVDVEERPSGSLTRKIAWWHRTGKRFRYGTEVHRQKLRSQKTIARWLRKAGFRARVERRVPAAGRPVGNVLFVARKS